MDRNEGLTFPSLSLITNMVVSRQNRKLFKIKRGNAETTKAAHHVIPESLEKTSFLNNKYFLILSPGFKTVWLNKGPHLLSQSAYFVRI